MSAKTPTTLFPDVRAIPQVGPNVCFVKYQYLLWSKSLQRRASHWDVILDKLKIYIVLPGEIYGESEIQQLEQH